MFSVPSRKLRVGLLAQEFLVNIGANDFLKNIIRGLAAERDVEIIFLCPRSNERIENATPHAVKETIKRVPFLKRLLRAGARVVAPATDRLLRVNPAQYAFYAEVCPRMEFVVCEVDARQLAALRTERGIDLFMPSIHVLPLSLPYVTYWPDCQPKYYPEFFNEEAQRVRDERILGLLASGKPMIINSRAAKADMCRFYEANPDQVFDLPFAPIIEFDKLVPRPELLNRYKLPETYFAICNQFWIHKSIETVFQAVRIAKDRGIKVTMVFTGKMEEPRKPGYIDGLRRMVDDLDIADMVRLLEYIPKDDQIEVIKGAVAVVQPTLFEGGPGGGSVYDAVSLGVRAIVSDIPVNHELPLHPDRLVLFRTRDPSDLVEKMQNFLDTPCIYPSSEDLFRQSRHAVTLLSRRLYEAIDYELSGKVGCRAR
jgi:glycosyltransferase involved in cell wall biosynthesis